MRNSRLARLVKIGGAVLVGTAAAVATAIGRGQASVELKAGDVAPPFTLQGSDGRTYTLAEYRDRQAVVVAWFPKAFTGGCTIECKSLREGSDAIRAFDVAYFTASADDAKTNAEFARSVDANYPILSDSTKAVARAYGVLGLIGMPSRWTFYIGKDGRIAHIDKSVKVASAGQDIAAKLGELGIAKR